MLLQWASGKEKQELLKYTPLLLQLQVILFSNDLHYPIWQAKGKQQFQPFRFWVSKRNNGALVKNILQNRWWWNRVKGNNESVHFGWASVKQPVFFSRQPLVTLSPERPESKPVRVIPQTPEEYCHLMSLLTEEQQGQWSVQLAAFKSKASFSSRALLSWMLTANPLLKAGSAPESLRVHNHLPFNYHLGNKKALYHNLKNYLSQRGVPLDDFIPETFHITSPSDPEYLRFQSSCLSDKKALWIIKPGEYSNQGRGINVCQSVQEIDRYINKSV